jgi:endonuclease/exonuclease/phosphatase family metal-dependent hydrolase
VARLRVAAYNVHGFRAGTRAVAEALRQHEPDVLILNEVGYFGLRLWRFRRRMGMARASGLRPFRPVRSAILARPPWRLVGKHVERLPREETRVQRGMVFALARRAGQRLTLVALHLGLSGRERERHARHVTDVVAGVPHPVVLGGDLNEGPDGSAASWISERFWDPFADGASDPEALTFPAREPRARIDYLFVSEGIEVERVWVGQASEASDHLPVFADLRVGG